MTQKSTLPAFYSIVSLFTGLDMAIVICMVWFGLKTTGSTFLIGVTLCVATVVPYLCQQLLTRYRRVELNLTRLFYIRLVAFCAILGLSFTDATVAPAGFLLIAFAVGVSSYFTNSTLEAKNTKLVLAGYTNSDTSSRFMQTAIQIGAFSGALLGGLIVDRFSLDQALQIISATALVALLAIVLVGATPEAPAVAKANAAGSRSQFGNELPRHLLILIVVLSLIGFHIGAFNSLIPIVFQKLNEWNATRFGIASGLAGLGAFSAAVLPRIQLKNYMAIALILLADILLVYMHNLYLMMLAAFALGFSINSLRIQVRRALIDATSDARMADTIASKSALYYLLVSASAPMILTFFTTSAFLGIAGARGLMIVAALLLGFAVLGWMASRQALPLPTAK